MGYGKKLAPKKERKKRNGIGAFANKIQFYKLGVFLWANLGPLYPMQHHIMGWVEGHSVLDGLILFKFQALGCGVWINDVSLSLTNKSTLLITPNS